MYVVIYVFALLAINIATLIINQSMNEIIYIFLSCQYTNIISCHIGTLATSAENCTSSEFRRPSTVHDIVECIFMCVCVCSAKPERACVRLQVRLYLLMSISLAVGRIIHLLTHTLAIWHDVLVHTWECYTFISPVCIWFFFPFFTFEMNQTLVKKIIINVEKAEICTSMPK